MFNFYHYLLYLLLQFETSQKCNNTALPLLESRPSQVTLLQTLVVAWAQHQSQDQDSAWRPHTSLPALDIPMGRGGNRQLCPSRFLLGPVRASPLGRVPFPSHVILLSCPRQEVSRAGDACPNSSPAGEAFALPKCLPCQHVPDQPQDSTR